VSGSGDGSSADVCSVLTTAALDSVFQGEEGKVCEGLVQEQRVLFQCVAQDNADTVIAHKMEPGAPHVTRLGTRANSTREK